MEEEEEEEEWHGVEDSDIQSIGIHTSHSNSSGTYLLTGDVHDLILWLTLILIESKLLIFSELFLR